MSLNALDKLVGFVSLGMLNYELIGDVDGR